MGLARDSAVLSIVNVIVKCLGKVGSLVIFSVLGPALSGLYYFIASIIALLVRVGNCGAGGSVVYFLRKNKVSQDQMIGNSVFLAALLTFIVWLGGAGFYYVWNIFVPEDGLHATLILLIALSVPPGILFTYFHTHLLGSEKQSSYTVFAALGSLIFFTAIILLLLSGDFSIPLLLCAGITRDTLLAIGLFFVVYKLAKGKIGWKPDIIKSMLKYGAKAEAANTVAFLNYRMDVIILMAFAGLGYVNRESIGYYAFAVGFAESSWMLTNPVATMLFPRVAGMERREAAMMSSQVCRISLFIIMFVVPLTVLLAFLLVHMPSFSLPFSTPYELSFGNYEVALLSLYLLLPGVVATVIPKMLTNLFSAEGKPEYGLYVSLIAFIGNITLNAVLIPLYQERGAAVATSITYTIEAVVAMIIFKRMTGLSHRDSLFIRSEDIRLLKEKFSDFIKTVGLQKVSVNTHSPAP